MMRLYEHEAKSLFRSEGIPVPVSYGVFSSGTNTEIPPRNAAFPMMVKSLVLVGGRGKAGGIRKAGSWDEVRRIAGELLGSRINGHTVGRILVEAACDPKSALYVGVTMNPATFENVLIVSRQGGVDIEQAVASDPGAVFREDIPGNPAALPRAMAHDAARFLYDGGNPRLVKSLESILFKLYALYQKYDCKIAEINPLLGTDKGWFAADAKIMIDDNALYRQGTLLSLLKIRDNRHDASEPTSNEIRARKASIPYVDLLPENTAKNPDLLYIGLCPGGAGYGIFSIDEVSNIGNRFFDGRVVPINFMDSGGGPTVRQVSDMFHLLMDNPMVDVVISSRFGGISSCDTYIRGLVNCLRQRKTEGKRMIPVYGRMVGTDLPTARAFLEKARQETPEALADLVMVVGNQTIMADVIKDGIRRAMERKERLA
jgi:succinyl-CoA synthetase beta subunit